MPTTLRTIKQEAKEAIEEAMSDMEVAKLTLDDYTNDFATVVIDMRRAKARLDRKYTKLVAQCAKLGVKL